MIALHQTEDLLTLLARPATSAEKPDISPEVIAKSYLQMLHVLTWTDCPQKATNGEVPVDGAEAAAAAPVAPIAPIAPIAPVA